MAAVSDGMLDRLTSRLRDASWTAGDLEAAVRDFAASEGLGLGKVAQPLRIALTGRTVSPGVFDMMQVLGREESLARLRECAERGAGRHLRRPGPRTGATRARLQSRRPRRSGSPAKGDDT